MSHATRAGLVSRSTHLLRLPLLAVALTAIMLTLTLRTALAGPTLTVSENPVIIANGQNTKLITLGWNLNGAAGPDTLTFLEVGGPVLVTDIVAGAGSKTVQVTYGKTYQARLSLGAGSMGTETLQQITITTKRPDTAPNPCPGTVCITNVKVTPHGTWALFDVTVSQPSTIKIETGDNAPDANGHFTVVRASVASSNLLKTQFGLPLMGLSPDLFQNYAVRATDAQAHTAVSIGTFKTLRRQVTVDFNMIEMVDDSDALGDCECTFDFFANGIGPVTYINQDFATGDKNNPNAHLKFFTKSPTLKLTVHAGDDDESCEFTLCVCGLGAPAGNGKNECAEFSEADGVFTFQTGFNEGENSSFVLTANGGNGSSLKYKVFGKYQVSYLP